MRALGPSNCSGLWKTRRNDQGLPHGLEATKRGERSAAPLSTNRFLPNKRLAQSMNNWHGFNIQAGDSPGVTVTLSPTPRAGSIFKPLTWGSAALHPRAGSPAEHLGWGARLYAIARYRGLGLGRRFCWYSAALERANVV